METIIYIRLLGEGTTVYRPVLSLEVESNIFQIIGNEIYDPEDENWEFVPNTLVLAEKQIIDGEVVLVATKKIK